MTISSTTNRWEYTGDNSTDTFAYNNKIFVDSDLKVYLDAVLQTLDTDYTVSGEGTEGGGNVVFTTPPGSGVEIIIVRDVPNTQGTDLPPGGPFPASAVEDEFDKRAIIDQQLQEEVDRALKIPVTDTSSAQNYDAGGKKIENGADATTDTGYVTKSQMDLAIAASATSADAAVIKKQVSTLQDLVENNYSAYANVTVNAFRSTSSVGGAEWYTTGNTGTPSVWSTINSNGHNGTIIDAGGNEWAISPKNIDLKSFGAYADGVVDDDNFILSANAYGQLLADGGNYKIGTNLAITKDITFKNGAIFEPSAGVVLTISGQINANDEQIFNRGTGTIQLEGKAATKVSSLWFSPDPWDSFVEAVEQLASHRGGSVFLADTVYNADKTALISSEYPVNLIGNMYTAQQANSDLLVPGNYIAPKTGLGATDAIIEYSGDGGGHVKGLCFVDDGDITNATQKLRRTVSFGAALRFTEWNLSKCEDIYGLYLDASLIETGLCTMSTVRDIWVRRCGGVGKPAINIKNTGTGFSSQSFELGSIRAEVNYDTSYIELGTESKKCKLYNIGFEADVSDADTNKTFLNNAGDENSGTLIHLNRNTALKMLDSGAESTWDNIRSATGGNNGVIHSTGGRFTLVGYMGKNNTSATDEVLLEGLDSTFQGTIDTGGGVRATADNADIDVKYISLNGATNAAVEVQNKSKVTVDFRNPVASTDVVLLAGNTNRVYSSHIEDIASGKVGIKTSSSQNIILGNQIIAPTGATGIDTSTGANNNVAINNVQGAGTAYNLSGTDTSTANT